jgi:hypothetical protein
MEGWSDAMTMGKSGIASLGWKLSTEQKNKIHNSECHTLNFIPDIGLNTEGRSFYVEAVKLALEFIETKKCRVIDLKGSDCLQYGKDVNEIGKQKVTELINTTPFLTEGLAMEILTN